MKTFAKNKKAFHNFNVLKKLEAGISLYGTEVKSIRNGNVNFSDTYVSIEGLEAYMINLDIQPYEKAVVFNHEPKRKRKLLLHKYEIIKLKSHTDEKGQTIVPLMIYSNKKGKIKVEIGLCKSKNKVDKRQDMAKKDAQKKVRSILKNL